MDFPIQIKDVWKWYGAVPAVCGLSLNVPSRSVYGFLGPNGAGKSTTIRIVLGLQRPDRGGVNLFGRSPKIELRYSAASVPSSNHRLSMKI